MLILIGVAILYIVETSLLASFAHIFSLYWMYGTACCEYLRHCTLAD